jgi:RHS repeat-associated protein
MSYTPYGLPTLPMDGVGYTGHFMDVGTQLTYMQQRYYDPSIGRFLSPDPVPSNPNQGAMFARFTYANSNPLRFNDPDGRMTAADRKEQSAVRKQQHELNRRNANTGNGAGKTRSEMSRQGIGPNYSSPGGGVTAKEVVTAGSATATVMSVANEVPAKLGDNVDRAASKSMRGVLGPASIGFGMAEIYNGKGFAEKGHGVYATGLGLAEVFCPPCAPVVLNLQVVDLGMQASGQSYTEVGTEAIEWTAKEVQNLSQPGAIPAHPMER